MKKLIFIFLDGVGIGEADKSKNPFFSYDFKFLSNYFNEMPSLQNPRMESGAVSVFPVDATLGIDGLPQSGTGQVSLLCGFNGAEFIGKHFGPFPYSLHHEEIRSKNLFHVLTEQGEKVDFVNAYPKLFFDYLNKQKRRIGTFALSALYSGIRLKGLEELRSGKALSNDITNIRWQTRLNYKLKTIQPATAAKRLLKIADKNELTVFEYFLTDHIGHKRITENLNDIYKELDEFLVYILNNTPPETGVLIISDHGNFEDLSVKTHTFNPVFCMTKGVPTEIFKNNVKSLIDVKWAILELLKN